MEVSARFSRPFVCERQLLLGESTAEGYSFWTMGGCSSVAGERLRMVAGRWCFHIAEDSISAAGQSESEIPLRNAAGNIRDDIKVFCTLLEPIELLDIFSSAGDTAVAGLWLSKIMGFFSGFVR